MNSLNKDFVHLLQWSRFAKNAFVFLKHGADMIIVDCQLSEALTRQKLFHLLSTHLTTK